MSILVNPHNEQEERALLAFLNSMKYDYKLGIGQSEDEIMLAFLDQYNKEIDEAEADIDAGNFYTHERVEELLANRRKSK